MRVRRSNIPHSFSCQRIPVGLVAAVLSSTGTRKGRKNGITMVHCNNAPKTSQSIILVRHWAQTSVLIRMRPWGQMPAQRPTLWCWAFGTKKPNELVILPEKAVLCTWADPEGADSWYLSAEPPLDIRSFLEWAPGEYLSMGTTLSFAVVSPLFCRQGSLARWISVPNQKNWACEPEPNPCR